jgi:hypothetical protein
MAKLVNQNKWKKCTKCGGFFDRIYKQKNGDQLCYNCHVEANDIREGETPVARALRLHSTPLPKTPRYRRRKQISDLEWYYNGLHEEHDCPDCWR